MTANHYRVGARSAQVVAGSILVAAIVSASIFLPITKMQARCCFGDQCEWIESEMTYVFKSDVAALPVPRYANSSNAAYVSYWTRWTDYPPEIFMKYTGDIARWHFKNTPQATRPKWWPTEMHEKSDCCFVYPIALTEASWRELSRWKPRCGRDGRRAR